MNPLLEVRKRGQQIWLDNLSRTLLNDGELASLIADDGLAGVTTNPAIFQKAITAGRYYAEELEALKEKDLSAEARYERLAVTDVQRACDMLAPVFDRSRGDAGYVSLEVSPALANDEAGTVAAARRLREAVDRPNVLIKIPATNAGIHAIQTLIGEGVSINVTLMFSLADVDAVGQAYIRGIEQLRQSGGDISSVKSVASVFLSRVDTLVDKRLEALGGDATTLCGYSAVAMAKLAYQRYLTRFHGPEFADLLNAGARPQQLLWASTGTKNPSYDDLLYVEPLIGKETVNTVPDATLAALRDHGKVAETITKDLSRAESQFTQLEALGIDMNAVGEELKADGLRQFEVAFETLLATTA
ncbi:transaldolase [Cognatazoarcus halotolerans]|uniref:transaldolase n=1 Tax=Cognatazoarcus halotolerans TaxID=2686016 RepID=UPI001D840FA3|nr:transaldolase [Cognatazoarcus halotolerans]MCB1900128.1 transaldolase [Rhodocyclaceae bacterium]MCP5311311.1 transaldolase [Zoogloeaceae bacterium]